MNSPDLGLFLEMPHDSLSYIWSNIGCQHTLQPCGNDFLPPSIPSLTIRGFVKWEAVEILLDPTSHVPFLQHAVQKWHLKHPDDGTLFPAPLPAEAFPTEPDAEMMKWHEEKLEALKAEGPAEEKDKTPRPSSPRDTRRRRSPRPSPMSSPRRPVPKRGDSSSEDSFRGRRPGDVGSGVHYVYTARPSMRRPPGESYFPPVDEEGGFRRRSFSDHPSPTDRRPSPEFPRPPRAPQPRRYSQPRVNPIIVSSDSEDESPKMRSRAKHGSDPALHKMPGGRPSVRHAPTGFASPKRGYSPNLRPPPPDNGDRRKSFPFGDMKEKLMHTVSGILASNTGNGAGGKVIPERPRSSSRTNSHTSSSHLRPDEYVARREVESDDSDVEYDSSERGRRRRREQEKERGRLKAAQRARERDRERDARDKVKERLSDKYDERPLRPHPKQSSPYRRGGLHPDGPPRTDDWERYEGSRERPRHDRRRRDAHHAYRD